MSNPHGLDIDSEKNMVFVCDGMDGLKVYDYSNVNEIQNNQLNHIAGLNTYDIILNNGIAHMIGDDGLRQYSYDDAGTLVELSTIPLN